MLIRQQAALDWAYIYDNLTPLAELKESPALVTTLRQLEKRIRDLAT